MATKTMLPLNRGGAARASAVFFRPTNVRTIPRPASRKPSELMGRNRVLSTWKSQIPAAYRVFHRALRKPAVKTLMVPAAKQAKAYLGILL